MSLTHRQWPTDYDWFSDPLTYRRFLSKFWGVNFGHWGLNQQESPADARVTRDSAVIPRWPSAAILDIIKPEIASFDPPTPKTLAQTQTWSGSDAPFARYSPLNYTVDLETGVRDHSRSSKMALFDRARMTLYSSSIVTMHLSSTLSEI